MLGVIYVSRYSKFTIVIKKTIYYKRWLTIEHLPN